MPLTDPPAYLQNLPPLDDADMWDAMVVRFEQLKDTVLAGRLERHGDAVGTRDDMGAWRLSGPRSAANFIQFVSSIDQRNLQDRLDCAAQLVSSLDDQFSQRLATPAFARDWGLFCELAGSIELVAISTASDMQGDRSRTKKGAGQRKWVSAQLLALMAGGLPRQYAEAEIVKRVLSILAAPAADDRFPHEWFRQVVTPNGALRRTYTSVGDLPEHELKGLAETPFEIPGLPARD